MSEYARFGPDILKVFRQEGEIMLINWNDEDYSLNGATISGDEFHRQSQQPNAVVITVKRPKRQQKAVEA